MAHNVAAYQALLQRMTRIFRMAVTKTTPYYPTLCSVISSTKRYENYSFLANFPGMREWLGDREFHDLEAAEFEIKNRTFESSIGLDRFDVDDDVFGLLPQTMEELAAEASYHPDELLFELINDADNVPCIDGQTFFSNAHQWSNSGVQSNKMDLDVVDPTVTEGATNVTPDEFRGAVHKMVQRMFTFKRPNGKYFRRPVVGALPGLVIQVPLVMREVAHKAFEQRQLANGEDNFYIDQPRIVVAQYSGADNINGSDTRVDLYSTRGRIKPYVFQVRKRLTTGTNAPQTIEFKDLKWMSEYRCGVGPMAWWEAIRGNFV